VIGAIFFLVAAFALWFGFSLAWLHFTISKPFKNGAATAPFWAWWSVQLTLFTGLIFLLHGQFFLALFNAALPPLLIFTAFDLKPFVGFIAKPMMFAAIVTTVTLIATFAKPLRWRKLSFGLALICGSIIFFSTAEKNSQLEMCRAAKQQGLTEIERYSFWRSFQNTPREFQFEIHAIANNQRGRWGWSYRELSFYFLKPTISADVSRGSILNCD